jgi:transcriptional regulator with XRE-family HTH domain
MSATLSTLDLWYLYPNGFYKRRGRVVGERIREIRVSRGMSRSDLGRRIGVRTYNIRNWENGGTPKDSVMVDEMARALNVSIGYLFGETDNPDNYAGLRELVRIIVT